MALDIASVARVLGGEFVSNGVRIQEPIDGIARVSEYVVVGNSAYVTLITGTVDQLQTRLDAVGAAVSSSGEGAKDIFAPLHRAVFVSTENSASLRELLAENNISAILGIPDTPEALHAQLSALIAEEQAAADRLVTAGTIVLTQVARRGGATAVIAELAQRIDGWAVLVDAHGHLIASAGAGRLHVNDAIAVALGKQVRVRHPGLQTHQVGSDREVTGHLIIASRSDAAGRNRDLASQAAALFDLVLRTRDPSLTEQLGREALLNILLSGGDSAVELLQRWGVRDSSLTAFAIGTKSRTVDLEKLVERWFDELGGEHIFISEPGRVSGFLQDNLVDELHQKVANFRPIGSGLVHLGLGLNAPVDALQRSAAQAAQALTSALEDGRLVLRFAQLPTVEHVLDALSEDATQQLGGLLDRLRDATGKHGDLTQVLQVFLSKHGAHRASAAELGIHRQTLLARIQQIEQLTGLMLDRPDDRATAWLALRALGK